MERKYFDEQDEHIMTNTVKAGKRTYFIDVKETTTNDYFLTITESRKKVSSDGASVFERHKIFLYKEDFDKFSSGLSSAIDFIKKSKPEYFASQLENDYSLDGDVAKI